MLKYAVFKVTFCHIRLLKLEGQLGLESTSSGLVSVNKAKPGLGNTFSVLTILRVCSEG